MSNIVFKAPSACTAGELQQFEELVNQGTEVSPDGLGARIRRAKLLGFAKCAEALVGVGALKVPEDSHRKGVAERSGITLPAETYPYEIGWLFVLPESRNHKFGRELMDGLIAAAGETGVYGTSRSDENHEKVHAALKRRGFQQVGKPYPSNDGKTVILLFTRAPAF